MLKTSKRLLVGAIAMLTFYCSLNAPATEATEATEVTEVTEGGYKHKATRPLSYRDNKGKKLGVIPQDASFLKCCQDTTEDGLCNIKFGGQRVYLRYADLENGSIFEDCFDEFDADVCGCSKHLQQVKKESLKSAKSTPQKETPTSKGSALPKTANSNFGLIVGSCLTLTGLGAIILNRRVTSIQ